jgi:hypothetical protein
MMKTFRNGETVLVDDALSDDDEEKAEENVNVVNMGRTVAPRKGVLSPVQEQEEKVALF